MSKVKILLEIDCPPTMRLQEPLSRSIFKDILHQKWRVPDHTFFGNWDWEITVTEEQHEKIKKFLTRAYEQNLVRYAGWGEIDEKEEDDISH